MAETFQVVASALATAELALKIYHQLSTFVAKAKRAEETAKGLAAKAQSLQMTLNTIQLTLG
jgi:conjugal transfer/entry exclusion protein